MNRKVMKYVELENNLRYKLNFDRVVHSRYIFLVWFVSSIIKNKLFYFLFMQEVKIIFE